MSQYGESAAALLRHSAPHVGVYRWYDSFITKVEESHFCYGNLYG